MGCSRGHFSAPVSRPFVSFEMGFSELVHAVEFVNEHDMRGAWNASGREADQPVCDCLDPIKITFVW
jgi:hypothetical protein